ncbi:YicC family protein [Myroides marinus]|nr:YicC/YloC family endoribonuclease [Myroides marinus]MDM1346361.1 YicC family protein [Myroides marinus]MDM1351237.1 YicC family protein [Myroides marinus]MDM1353960.1 YicC family protein [Myroides marinus]MDM1358494.1 YicC family protein [Myroides marinus]MDM1360157.1 YicC family protein [Myroides marinus]
MTGFGKACLQLPTKKITVEVKSLNSKSLDLNVRLPLTYREKELPLRNLIAQELERGKVDFSLYSEITAEETSNKINGPIVMAYIDQMKAIIPDADATELMKMAVRMPDALKVERAELDENEWKEIEKVITEAIANMKEFRASEGSSLENDFRLRIGNIRKYMDEVSVLDKERIVTVKERLRANLVELQLNIDENRYEQEVIYYLEKMDITEEKVRLSKHLDYFIETLEGAEANGRKLGFIGQEMGREINTMGSKSNHAEMQKIVVKMKDELEKIKEQVLNVL